MTIAVGASLRNNDSSPRRRRSSLRIGRSARSIPCRVNTFLDVSMPMRLYSVTDGSLVGLFTAPTLAHDAAGPSTPTMTVGAAAALSVGQIVELRRIVAGDLADVLGRQTLELLVDILGRLGPDAVGVRVVRPPHQRIRRHQVVHVEQLRSDRIELERRLALALPVLGWL